MCASRQAGKKSPLRLQKNATSRTRAAARPTRNVDSPTRRKPTRVSATAAISGQTRVASVWRLAALVATAALIVRDQVASTIDRCATQTSSVYPTFAASTSAIVSLDRRWRLCASNDSAFSDQLVVCRSPAAHRSRHVDHSALDAPRAARPPSRRPHNFCRQQAADCSLSSFRIKSS